MLRDVGSLNITISAMESRVPDVDALTPQYRVRENQTRPDIINDFRSGEYKSIIDVGIRVPLLDRMGELIAAA